MKNAIVAAIFLFVAWAAGPPAWSDPPSGDPESLSTQCDIDIDTGTSEPGLGLQNVCTSTECAPAFTPQASPEVLAAVPIPAPRAASVSEVRTRPFRDPWRADRLGLDDSFYAKMDHRHLGWRLVKPVLRC